MLSIALEELDKHATGGTRVKKSHLPFRALARRAVDELDAGRGQAIERGHQVGDLETQVVHRGAPPLGQEARHARLRVGRLEQLDPRLALAHEYDTNPLLGERVLGSDRVAEDVAIEGNGL